MANQQRETKMKLEEKARNDHPRLMKCIYIGTGHPISTQIFCNVCIICPAVCRPPAILRESRQHASEIVTCNSWLLSHGPQPTANDQQKSSATGLQ